MREVPGFCSAGIYFVVFEMGIMLEYCRRLLVLVLPVMIVPSVEFVISTSFTTAATIKAYFKPSLHPTRKVSVAL